MAKKIALAVLGILLLAVLAVAAGKDDRFHVERSREIDAPRATLVPLVGELRNWPRWLPWAELDPNQTLTYGERSSGVGGSYAWRGNDQVGSGRVEITAVDEGASQTTLDFDLVFIEPFASESDVRIRVVDRGEGRSLVSWSMTSQRSFVEKIFAVFMDVETMLGADFERGLASIERIATAARAADDAR